MSVISRVSVTVKRLPITNIAVVILLACVVAVYTACILSLDNYKISLVLIAVPMVVSLFIVKDSPRLLLTLLILALGFSARFRFGGAPFHPGGAEAALAPLDFPLFGLVFLYIAEIYTKGRKLILRLTAIDKAFLLFIAVHIPSLIVASDQNLALLEIARLIKIALIFLVVRHYIKTKKDLSYVVGLLFISVILQGFLTVGQSLLGSSFGLGFLGEHDTFVVLSRGSLDIGRFGGTLGHPNVLANFLEMLVPLAMAVYLSPIRGWLRTLAIGACVAGLLGLILTFSRAGWGSILIGFTLVFLLAMWLHSKKRSQIFVYGFIVFFLIIIIGSVFQGIIFDRFTTYTETSWHFRINTYRLAWHMIQDNPLFGVGANNYMIVVDKYLGTMSPIFASSPTHNILLLIFAEVGLCGLAAFFLVLFSIVRQTFRIIKSNDTFTSTVAVGIGAGIVALLAHAMMDWLFRYDSIHTLFWFIVGLLIATGNIARKEMRQEESGKSYITESK